MAEYVAALTALTTRSRAKLEEGCLSYTLPCAYNFMKIFKQKTGSQIRREVPIPEFARLQRTSPSYDEDDTCRTKSRNAADAIMDVVSFSPTGEEYLLDASVRNPLAKRYAVAAFSRPGFAANCGEQDKLGHYPPTGGNRVEPCVIESLGRMGKRFIAVLNQACFISQKYNADLSTEIRNLKDEWLTDIFAALNKAIARNYCTSMHGNLSGNPPIHTFFPAAPMALSANLLLYMQASPLTSTRHNSVPTRAFSTFCNRLIASRACGCSCFTTNEIRA